MGLVFLVRSLLRSKLKYPNLFLAVGTLIVVLAVYFVCQYSTAISGMYGRSIFCFALGAIVSLYEKQVMSIMNKKKYFLIILSVTITLFVISYFLLPERYVALTVCMIIIVLASKLTLGNNTIYTFLGEISLEFYLVQKIFFRVLPITHVIYTSLAIIGATIVSAYLVHRLYVIIKKLVNLIKIKISNRKSNIDVAKREI